MEVSGQLHAPAALPPGTDCIELKSRSGCGGEEKSFPVPVGNRNSDKRFESLDGLLIFLKVYEVISKSFRTGRLERKLQMVQLSATVCSCIAILWLSLVSFAAITLCVASE
jgi:hypothetical protein